ncbi:hypothetical protein LSPCS325_20610 [Lysinibacillus sp. CTST325]
MNKINFDFKKMKENIHKRSYFQVVYVIKRILNLYQQVFFVAKAKRQRQMFSARKRSDSSKCFLRESEAAALIMPMHN